jgi:hypothetical protein
MRFIFSGDMLHPSPKRQPTARFARATRALRATQFPHASSTSETLTRGPRTTRALCAPQCRTFLHPDISVSSQIQIFSSTFKSSGEPVP